MIKSSENPYESALLKVQAIRMRNPDKAIIMPPQDKQVITSREDEIVQMCKETPNDMELGKKIREYINNHFN